MSARRLVSKRSWALLIGVGGLFASTEVLARCTAPSSTVSISEITVQRDVPIGSVIGSGSVVTLISCVQAGAGTGDNSWLIYPHNTNVDFGPTAVENARGTAWPGVGLRWLNYSSAAGGSSATWTRAALNSYVKSTGRGVPRQSNSTFTDTFELVKVGPIASGILPSVRMRYVHATPATNNVSDSELYTLTIPDIPVRAVACSVSQASIVVPMGNFIPKTRFTGPGSTDADMPFPIVLDCDSAARVNVQLDGTAVGGSAPGVLRLNADENAAQGIGVQVLQDGNPVTFGMPMFVGTSTVDGTYSIDFIARYYQVGATVDGGLANATATFTLTYN